MSNEVKREMPRYQSHKRVYALEIKKMEPLSAGHIMVSFCDEGYEQVPLPREMFARYEPFPGDFYVVYDDGYKSFSPRKAFLEGYTKVGSAPAAPSA